MLKKSSRISCFRTWTWVTSLIPWIVDHEFCCIIYTEATKQQETKWHKCIQSWNVVESHFTLIQQKLLIGIIYTISFKNKININWIDNTFAIPFIFNKIIKIIIILIRVFNSQLLHGTGFFFWYWKEVQRYVYSKYHLLFSIWYL